MVGVLVRLVGGLRRAWLFELAGAAAVTVGVWLLAGVAWAVITVGVAVLLKSYEIDAST